MLLSLLLSQAWHTDGLTGNVIFVCDTKLIYMTSLSSHAYSSLDDMYVSGHSPGRGVSYQISVFS